MLETYSENLDVEYIVSYQNLSNFLPLREKFESADILIIQPVNQYDDFKLSNLKRYLKEDCLIIKVPFLRFRGFWPDSEERLLNKFDDRSVMFFPDVPDVESVPQYLSGEQFTAGEIKDNFNNEIEKLKELEDTCDVSFVNYFLETHRKIPLFNDPYHPSWPFVCYIAAQLFDIISKSKGVCFLKYSFNFNLYSKENVYFKPITDKTADSLDLQFDLDNYFIENRNNYLTKIIHYETEPNYPDKIHSRKQLQEQVFHMGKGK